MMINKEQFVSKMYHHRLATHFLHLTTGVGIGHGYKHQLLLGLSVLICACRPNCITHCFMSNFFFFTYYHDLRTFVQIHVKMHMLWKSNAVDLNIYCTLHTACPILSTHHPTYWHMS